jgi:hypothetical protein
MGISRPFSGISCGQNNGIGFVGPSNNKYASHRECSRCRITFSGFFQREAKKAKVFWVKV